MYEFSPITGAFPSNVLIKADLPARVARWAHHRAIAFASPTPKEVGHPAFADALIDKWITTKHRNEDRVVATRLHPFEYELDPDA